MLLSEIRKGYQAKYSAIAICEYWIDENGKTTIMGLCRVMNSYYYDEELKSRYFGLEMTDGEINLHTLDSIDQYYDFGNRMKICCGSAHYFNKSESLVLVAYIGTKQVATIEIVRSDYHVIQCRGYANGSCEYSKRIADIISKNTSLIEERKTA